LAHTLATHDHPTLKIENLFNPNGFKSSQASMKGIAFRIRVQNVNQLPPRISQAVPQFKLAGL